MTEREAENLRDALKKFGVDAWTDVVVPGNRHGFSVNYKGVSRPRDVVAQIGTRVVLTPEEGSDLIRELKEGAALI